MNRNGIADRERAPDAAKECVGEGPSSGSGGPQRGLADNGTPHCAKVAVVACLESQQPDAEGQLGSPYRTYI